MPMEDADELLAAPTVAALLGVTDVTIRRWTTDGKLRHIRLPSGAARYRRSDVEAILTPVEPVTEATA